MKYENKVVVVTGAAGGVGRELVHQLLKKGASVATIDINKNALSETRMSAGSLSGKVSIHIADITDQNRVSNLPAEVIECHGHVDGIINNAGIIQPFIIFAELGEASCQRLMNINSLWNVEHVSGVYSLSRIIFRSLYRKCFQHGRLSSCSRTSYILGFQRCVQNCNRIFEKELFKTNIQVNLIIPGGIDTDIRKNSGLGDEGTLEKERKNAGVSVTSPADARNRGKVFCLWQNYLFI